MHYQLIHPPIRYPIPCHWDLADDTGGRLGTDPADKMDYHFSSGSGAKFRLSALALSIGLLSACSSLGQTPLFPAGSGEPKVPQNCNYVQRDLSVPWSDRYYWCRDSRNLPQPQPVRQTNRLVNLSSPPVQMGFVSSAPHLRTEPVATPVSIPVQTEPHPLPSQDDVPEDRIPVLTDVVDFPSSPSNTQSEPHFEGDSSPQHANFNNSDAEFGEAAQDQPDKWEPLSEKIWFVEGLQVLGPKSSSKVRRLANQLHPDKTIWLDGKLQLSDLTRLGPDRAKLLSIGRALAVKKALRDAGVEAPIRIKHPRLMAVGRFVVMEQIA